MPSGSGTSSDQTTAGGLPRRENNDRHKHQHTAPEFQHLPPDKEASRGSVEKLLARSHHLLAERPPPRRPTSIRELWTVRATSFKISKPLRARPGQLFFPEGSGGAARLRAAPTTSGQFISLAAMTTDSPGALLGPAGPPPLGVDVSKWQRNVLAAGQRIHHQTSPTFHFSNSPGRRNRQGLNSIVSYWIHPGQRPLVVGAASP